MKLFTRLLFTLALTCAGAGSAQASTAITVHKNPTCRGYEKYVDYLYEKGFISQQTKGGIQD
jgi:hypothetical protein